MAVGLHATNLANKILDHLRVGTAWTQPAGLFFKLHTADPGVGATAAAAGDTTRKSATYAAAASGSMSQSAATATWTNGGTSETLTHISVWDNVSAGVFLYSFPISPTQAWASGNTFSMATFSFALTPIAA
jgi:hypothetical protein